MKRSLLPALLFFPAAAPAAVVYSGLRDLPIPTNFAGVYLDAETGTTAAAEFSGWDLNVFFGGVGIAGNVTFQPARTGASNSDPVRRFGINELIISTMQFGSGFTGSSEHLGAVGNFQAGETGYLGFRFTLGNDPGGTPLYGWMRLTLTANAPGGVIHDWAWDSTGAAILTGQVPEPSAPALAAAAFASLAWSRRSRTKLEA